MERLHSGGRKFVVLDYGATILLTDVYIPACPNRHRRRLESVGAESERYWFGPSSRQQWHQPPSADPSSCTACNLRLSVAFFAWQLLADKDWVPLGASSCKISIGSPYGHSLILPNDLVVPAMQADASIPILGREEIMVSVLGFRYLFMYIFFLQRPFNSFDRK